MQDELGTTVRPGPITNGLAVQPVPLQPLARQQEAMGISYRPLNPQDLNSVKALHSELFPIDYEDSFFQKATNSQDRIFSWAAVLRDTDGQDQLAGFITARVAHLIELDTADRHYMQLMGSALDHEVAVYILTLGVAKQLRHRGIASTLLNLVWQHAHKIRSRAVFLHVITYNTAAIGLYTRHGYKCAARMPNFYRITTGRQPDPSRQDWDALLYVAHLSPYPGDEYQDWGGVLQPLHKALSSLNSFIPCFGRTNGNQQSYHQHPSLLQHLSHAAQQPYAGGQPPHHQHSYSNDRRANINYHDHRTPQHCDHHDYPQHSQRHQQQEAQHDIEQQWQEQQEREMQREQEQRWQQQQQQQQQRQYHGGQQQAWEQHQQQSGGQDSQGPGVLQWLFNSSYRTS